MNVPRLVLVGAVAMLAYAAPAFAQRVEVQPSVRPPIGFQINGPLLSADAIEKLKLTADQKDKYGKIEAAYMETSKAVQDKFRADIQNLGGRINKELIDKMQTDAKKTREDSLAKVEPILTAEQKTVFAQVKIQQPGVVIRPVPPIGGAGINQILPPGVQQRLQLTDEQKKQIEAIQKEVEAKIMKVLTDDQKKQLEDMKKPIIRPNPNPRPLPPVQIQRVPNADPANPAPRKD